MQSLTAYMQDYPHLKPDLIKFCQEERNHTEWHLKLNSLLENKNKLKSLEIRTEKIIHNATKFLTKKQRLLVTLCLEHITYLLANQLLQDKRLKLMMVSDAKKVWFEHAFEESSESHRTLAQKVVDEVGVSNLYKKAFMIPCSIALVCVVGSFWYEICKSDKQPKNLFTYIDSINTLFGVNGFITLLIPKYLVWYLK